VEKKLPRKLSFDGRKSDFFCRSFLGSMGFPIVLPSYSVIVRGQNTLFATDEHGLSFALQLPPNGHFVNNAP